MKKYILILVVLLIVGACRSTLYLSETELRYERVSEQVKNGDEDIDMMIAPYRDSLAAVMDEVIGNLEVSLTKESPESNIGNWLADMLYEESKQLNDGVLDFAVQNQGGIRVTGMSEGPITIGEVYEVMPFDNMISIISADGKGTKEFLDHIARGRGWPISKGLSFKIKDKKAVEITLHNEPLEDRRIYHFAVPDYIAGGGSGSDMLNSFKRKDIEVLIRDAFINHIKKDTKSGINQTAKKEGRIINLDHE